MRGRKPTPTAILRLHQSGHAKERHGELQAHGRPRMPNGLPADAKKLWKETVARLERYRLLGEADTVLLERYVRVLALWRQLIRKVEADGVSVTTITARGEEKTNTTPEAKQLSAFESQISKFEDRLGLSPLARQHLRAEQPASDDELAEFLDTTPPMREAAGG